MKNLNINEISDTIENIISTTKEKSLVMLHEILEQLPAEFSDLIEQTFIYKRVPKEYLLSSIFFTISTSIGLTFYIETLGYKNFANLYFIIIGSRGDTKSEAMKIATEPLKELDDKDNNQFEIDLKNCDLELDEIPVKKKILIQNATIEAVHKMHFENPNAVGMSYDEIYSIIEKMGNSSSRDGVAYRTFLLEGYTNGHVDILRITAKSFRIKETYPTMIGGLQSQLVRKLLANGNLESGFIDRLLFTPKLTRNNKLSKGQISENAINNYKSSILKIIAYKKQSETADEIIKQFKIKLSDDAENLLFDYTQELINKQNSAETIIKEYMAKMLISIHKFCLLVHMMNNSKHSNFTSVLAAETVELAIKINEFYFINFKIILDENLSNSNKLPTLLDVVRLAKSTGAVQKDVIALTKEHKSTVSRCWNKDFSNLQPATLKLVQNAS